MKCRESSETRFDKVERLYGPSLTCKRPIEILEFNFENQATQPTITRTGNVPFDLTYLSFGVRSDSVRDPFGVRSGSVWDPFRVRSSQFRTKIPEPKI